MSTPKLPPQTNHLLVGGGFIGGVHYDAIHLSNGIVVCIVPSHDLTAEKRSQFEAKWPGKTLYGTVREALTQELGFALTQRPHSATVTSIDKEHFGQITELLQAGVHVLGEKPLAPTVTEVHSLASLAKQMAMVNTVAFINRFHNNLRVMRELVGAGLIGDPITQGDQFDGVIIYNQDWQADPNDPTNWRQLLGGSGIFDIAVHGIDLARFMMRSEFSQVQARLRKAPFHQHPDQCSVWGTMANGATMTLETSQLRWGTENDIEVRITGPKGALHFSNRNSEQFTLFLPGNEVRLFSRGNLGKTPFIASNMPKDALDAILADNPRPSNHAVGLTDLFGSMYVHHNAMVRQHLETGTYKPDDVSATFHDAAQVAECVAAIWASSIANGQKVQVIIQ